MSCTLLNKHLHAIKTSIEKFDMANEVNDIVDFAKMGKDASFIRDMLYKDLSGGDFKIFDDATIQDIVEAVKEGKVNKPEDIMNALDVQNTPLSRNYKAYAYNLSKKEPFTEAIQTNPRIGKAIHAYTMDEYSYTNELHRDFWFNDNANLDDLKWLADINELFKYKGDYLGGSFRGTQVRKKVLQAMKPGDITISPSPISSTLNYDKAVRWAQGEKVQEGFTRAVFEIDNKIVPQYNITKYSAWPDEEEILMEPNMPFKVNKIYTKNNITHIKLEMIPLDTKDLVSGKKKGIYNFLSFGGLGVAIGIPKSEEN